MSKAHNLIERLNKSSECFEELYYFFIMHHVEKRRAMLVGWCLDNFYGFYASLQTFNFLIIKKQQQKRNKTIHKIISSTISKFSKEKGKRNCPIFWIRPGHTSSCWDKSLRNWKKTFPCFKKVLRNYALSEDFTFRKAKSDFEIQLCATFFGAITNSSCSCSKNIDICFVFTLEFLRVYPQTENHSELCSLFIKS